MPSDSDFLGLLFLGWYESSSEPQLLEFLERSGKDEGVWGAGCLGNGQRHFGCVRSLGERERDVEIHNQGDLCLRGGGGGGHGSGIGGGVNGSDGVMRVAVLMVVVEILVLVMVVRVVFIRVVEVVGVLGIEVLEVDWVGMVNILMLGAVFVVEVVEGVELVGGCIVRGAVRLVLWSVNGTGYFLCCFRLKSVEMNGLSVGGFLFGMVIWADCFILFERGFLSNMVGADMFLDVQVVETIVVETVDVVQV